MKKGLLLTIMICLASISLFAQQTEDKKKKEQFEKFKTEREEFISKAMKLTADEKKEFWPLCNELQLKKFELNKPLREEMRKIHKARKANQPVSEAEYKKVIELNVEIKKKEAQLEQEYVEKFLKVLPAEKVFLYQSAERQFGKETIGKRDHRE
jgi:Spy/CpxP family protein refolding chaperone